MFFVGIDWSEQHHDVCVLDELGAQRATLRIPEGIVGVARFHELAEQLGCAPVQLVWTSCHPMVVTGAGSGSGSA
jgi:hypothetical protein